MLVVGMLRRKVVCPWNLGDGRWGKMLAAQRELLRGRRIGTGIRCFVVLSSTYAVGKRRVRVVQIVEYRCGRAFLQTCCVSFRFVPFSTQGSANKSRGDNRREVDKSGRVSPSMGPETGVPFVCAGHAITGTVRWARVTMAQSCSYFNELLSAQRTTWPSQHD